jgi:hypothetical protein
LATATKQPPEAAGDEHRGGEDGLSARPGEAVHQAGRLLVEAEGDAEGGVDEEVDPEDLDGCERLAGRQVEEGRPEEGEQERDQLQQDEADVLGQLLARRLDVPARLVRKDEQRALRRVADDLAVHELGVAGHHVGQDRVVDRVGPAGGVVDLDRWQVLDDRLLFGELDAAEGPDDLHDHRQRQRDRGDRERHRGVEQRRPRLPAAEAQREHHGHREAGRADDPQRQSVHLLRERRVLINRGCRGGECCTMRRRAHCFRGGGRQPCPGPRLAAGDRRAHPVRCRPADSSG